MGADVREQVIAVNGLRLHYRARGDVALPPLVMLHGLTGNAWEWDTIAMSLADDFHVLVVDQRGHGESEWTPDYSPDLMSEDIAAVITTLGPGRVHIVGHSMGGINAYLLAARWPELVDRLVIVDIGPDSLATEWVTEGMPVALRAWEQASYAEPDDAVVEFLLDNPRARETELRRAVIHNLRQREDGRWVYRFDAARLGRYLERANDEFAHWEVLRQISRPTLVIRGGESSLLSAATAERMTHEIDQCRLVEIPNTGHDIHIEQPEELVAAARRFLTSA